MRVAASDTSYVRDLLRAILSYVGPKLFPVLGIVVLAAALEGLGIVLLLPVAETIFAHQDGATTTGVTAFVLQWLEAAGLVSVMAQITAMGLAFVALVALRAAVLLRRDVMLAELSFGFVDGRH